MSDPFANGRRVAVLIGQNSFEASQDLHDLKYSHADIEAVSSLLHGETGTVYDQVIKVPSCPHYEAMAKMDAALAELKRDDTVMVYYSGHGVVDRHGRLHLAFANTADGMLSSSAIKVGHMLEMLQASYARKRVLVLDCCYAGAVGAEFSKSGVSDQMRAEVQGTGTVVLTATTKLDVAKENPDYGHGIFTKHFLDGLEGAADVTGDGIVTVQELYDYVYGCVAAESPQRPIKFNLNTEGQIALRHTGRTPWKERSDALRLQVLDLSGRGYLGNDTLKEALDILSLSPSEMDARTRAKFDLLDGINLDTFRPAPFAEQWESLEPEPAPALDPDPAPAPDPAPEAPKVHAFAETAAAYTPPPAALPVDPPVSTEKPPAPAWQANVSVGIFALFPGFYSEILYGGFISAVELGLVLILTAIAGIWTIFTRFIGPSGTAQTLRKVVYAGLGGLFALGGLGNVLYPTF